jgi:hypothetical protein
MTRSRLPLFFQPNAATPCYKAPDRRYARNIFGSPLAHGCIPSKFVKWPVTGQAHALQCHEFNESLLPSNGSWTEHVSDTEGDANENTSSNKDGDKGQTPHTHVCPTTLFNNNRNPGSHPMERDEVSLLDRIWLGSTLLTRFVACHFAGDWNRYLPFAHWADSQLLEYPSSSIQLDN